jgi:hypothetical protein
MKKVLLKTNNKRKRKKGWMHAKRTQEPIYQPGKVPLPHPLSKMEKY